MQLSDLKPGMLLRITKATPNPNRDRRVSRDWRSMDLPEGAELICVYEWPGRYGEANDSRAIELRPYAGLEGAQHQAIRNVVMGWCRENGMRFTLATGSATGPLAELLLSVIEPFEPRNVDDALAVFNVTSKTEISYEDIALTLLDELDSPTLEVFKSTAARLAGWNAETDGDNWHEYERRVAEFNAKAYKPAAVEPAGDMEPEHTIRKGGSITCAGCGVTFSGIAMSVADSLKANVDIDATPVEQFTQHLPCKGKK